MINCLTNSQLIVLPNKWRFNTNQDWKVLRDNFESVSLETIPDTTLQALGFHYSPLGYSEKKAPLFVDVTDKPKIAIEPKDNGQPITDSEDEKIKKKVERVAEKKTWRDNLCAFVR